MIIYAVKSCAFCLSRSCVIFAAGQMPPPSGGGGNPTEGGVKGAPASGGVEFERHPLEEGGGPGGYPSSRHYHHHHHGSQFIQGAPTTTSKGGKQPHSSEKHHRTGPPNPDGQAGKFVFGPAAKQHGIPSGHGGAGPAASNKEYQLPTQPPTLSQAPPGNEPRSGKSQTPAGPPHHGAMASYSPRPAAHYSPRPGSASFRRSDHAANSAMLRSMSEDDLRHHKLVQKHHEHHRQHPYADRPEQHPAHPAENKKGVPMHALPPHGPPPGEHILVRGAPPHFVMHQIPHGSLPPPPHSPAANYTRLPPVMSVSALEHQQHQQHHHRTPKGSRDDLNKLAASHAAVEMANGSLAYHERERSDREKLSAAHEHARDVREHEQRMMLLHERGGLHPAEQPQRGPKGARIPVYSTNLPYEHGGIPGQHHEQLYHHCKACGKKFKSKLLFEGHVCSAEAEKHPSHGPSPFHHHHHHQQHHPQHHVADPREFHEHIMMTHGRDNPGSGGVTKDGKLTDCMKCGKSFQKPADLARHMSTPGECSNPS